MRSAALARRAVSMITGSSLPVRIQRHSGEPIGAGEHQVEHDEIQARPVWMIARAGGRRHPASSVSKAVPLEVAGRPHHGRSVRRRLRGRLSSSLIVVGRATHLG